MFAKLRTFFLSKQSSRARPVKLLFCFVYSFSNIQICIPSCFWAGLHTSFILNCLLGWDGTISRHMPISNCFVVVQVVELQIYDGIFEHVNVKRFCTYGFHFKGLGLIWETTFFYPTETLQLVISYQLSPQNIRLRCADGISSFDILFSWCLKVFFLVVLNNLWCSLKSLG